MNAWAKDSASNALGRMLHFLVGNLSRVNTAWSEFKSKQTTKNIKSTKDCWGPTPRELCDIWRKIEKITLSCVIIGKTSLDVSGTMFFIPLLSSNIQTNIFPFFFFLQILLGSIGSGNLKWINCTLQIYRWHYSFLGAKSSSTIVVCSKRDVWWLISALDAVHLALLPA